MAIYEYDDEIRNLLYQFKGCYDIELKDIFLEKFRIELFLWYFSYVIVPVPSFSDEDNRRGFNHVLEIFKTLKLPIVKVLSKVSQFKQADHTAEQRKQILKHLEIDTSVNLKNKSVLLVDDVFTTGSTIKACISLIKQLKPKRIDVLVMSKTVLKDK